MDAARAIERCAYCREFVPVTYREVGDGAPSISAEVAVCEECYGDGR
ncbi:MAG: hypothetical protein ABEJ68_10310 [Halobacteriaceae archaeon]